METTKGKIFLIIGILILLLGVPAGIMVISQRTGFRLGAKSTDQPEGVQISSITEQSARITWISKNPSQGLISYGLSPTDLTLIKPETVPAINHQIDLIKLFPETKYFFVIKVADKVFDNNDQPYTFTTLEKEIIPSPTIKPSPSLTEEGMQAVMGTDNPTYDLNKDGVVNAYDLLLLRQQNK